MKVSKTVSLELELLQKVLEENPSFSSAVTEALENWLSFKKETERGNSIHYSRTFTAQLPAEVIWEYLTFERMVKLVPILNKIEFLSDNHTGLGTKCKIYAELAGKKLVTTSEITEYNEYNRIVFRSDGDFRLFVSASLTPKTTKTDIALIAVIGLSNEFSSTENKNEIYQNMQVAFKKFGSLTKSQ